MSQVTTEALPKPPHPLRTFISRRHGGLVLFFAAFLGISFLTRVALLLKAAADVSWSTSLLAAFGWGIVYDVGAACFASLPLIVLLTVLPSGALRKVWVRWLAGGFGFAILFALLFGAAAEWTFWDEFGVRFNFIAVDYLVYTTEVLGNIRESYPLPLIAGGLFTAAGVFGWLLWRSRLPHAWLDGAVEHWPRRYRNGGLWFAGALVVGLTLNADWLPAFRNNFDRELAKNGLWSLFAAFRNNILDYDEFYPTKPLPEVFARLHTELAEDGAIVLRPGEYDTLRYIKNPGPELRPNVIQITVESLSASFLGIFNPESRLTPNLDTLAPQSLVFENFYATGTRTDRGMEALSLSLPPTPGRSMIKRPRNEDMFTLGSVFRAKGYDTAFIYGGFGYFDNMNYYFGHNGYRVIDRAAVPKDDITFANVWGACDEDLFRWTLREADASAAAGRPFHHFVMTTSNHRPYTFPEGRIDLPSKVSGRAGAVKYTDYAIGWFLREAAKRPWFKDTVFVIVADHCAASAGRTELPVENYHIPLIIHAPGGHIAPGRIQTLTSQMDFAPTLLGLLNWSYPSRFFGHNVRKVDPADAHALIGNYQKLGHLEKGEFVILRPRGESTYRYEFGTNTMTPIAETGYGTMEAISFYQGASYLYKHGRYRSLSAEEFTRYTHLGEEMAASVKGLASTP